jgi:organic hydroperoxide reductase OsmC/OhrA
MKATEGLMIKRSASAEWRGGLKDGKGTVSSGSGVLKETQYSFGTRFESGQGTNPEELIAAAQPVASRWRYPHSSASAA